MAGSRLRKQALASEVTIWPTRFRCVVVEGPIGVGKTTLARRLAEVAGSNPVLEEPEKNPFLERFYQARDRYALATQLHFLFQRVGQLERLETEGILKQVRIYDFMVQKDPLFAKITLDEDEFYLYSKIYQRLVHVAPASCPDLVIYLQAPLPVLLGRIEQRGRIFEFGIDKNYLQNLVDAYSRYFLAYTESPLLVVNAAEINFAESPDDFRQLLHYIQNLGPGRNFYNPTMG
ncbi:MAG TPA: deoxynucleoside kinase [Gammaproteobacteria bacterium]|nr:deoxynucleoside kinase [Gammaproteobacteria bacterium]